MEESQNNPSRKERRILLQVEWGEAADSEKFLVMGMRSSGGTGTEAIMYL